MKEFIDLAFLSGTEGRADCQWGWQVYAGTFAEKITSNKGLSILDVGAGLGLSRNRLQGPSGVNKVTLQDVAPNLPVDITTPIEEIPDNSYDMVTAFDVIEHIVKDTHFLAQLNRVSKEFVIVTTPNYNISKNGNPYHVREYTPSSLINLVLPYEVLIYISGDGSGNSIKKYLTLDEFIKHNDAHHGFILRKD